MYIVLVDVVFCGCEHSAESIQVHCLFVAVSELVRPRR